MLILNGIRAELHQHYPVEIYIALDEPFEIYLKHQWYQHKAVIFHILSHGSEDYIMCSDGKKLPMKFAGISHCFRMM